VVVVSSYRDALCDDRERRRRAQRTAERRFHKAVAAEEHRAERAATRLNRAQRAEQARQELVMQLHLPEPDIVPTVRG